MTASGFVLVPLARAITAAGGGGAEAAVDLCAELERRHAEPHRRYHTAEHVAEVQAELARLTALDAGHPVPDDAIVVAAMFHDAVYDVRAAAGASEAASVDLAVDRLEDAGVAPGAQLLEDVRRLVLLTAGHEDDDADRPGALLVDADLWILSSPPERYDRYVVDVRAEYAHVPDDLWRVGRGAVLQHFLDASDALYAFGPHDDRAARRHRARANLQRELGTLAEPGDGERTG